MHADDDPITAAVFDFVEQWTRDAERGAVHDLDYYLARFPGQAAAIQAEYEALRRARSKAAPPVRDARQDPLGRRIGPYEIVRELGRGGQGAVYLARDSRLSREVALKILPPAAFVSAARLERFRREADVVASLSHPGICDVIDADFAGEVPYIAMRFVAGRPLSEENLDGAPDRRGIRRAILLIEYAARALHVAHEAGVVHRDIKPANIIVTPAGDPVILDFGLAREAGDISVTEPGAVFGTLDYMAPEQLAEDPLPIDRRTDVHALAVTLYELVTATRPYAALSRQVLARRILADEAKDPRAINSYVPADLVVVLRKALEKDPARRYPTALAFAEDLRRVVAYEPIHARPAGMLLKLRRWARRHPIVSICTALASTLLTSGLVITLILLDRVVHERERYKAIFYATHARKLVEQDAGFALLTAIESAKIERSFLANTALYEILEVCREEQRIVPAARAATSVFDAGAAHVATIDPERRCTVDVLAPGSAPAWMVPMRVASAAFDPLGKTMVAGGEDGSLVVFAAGDGARVAELPRLAAPVAHVALGPGGRLVVASSAAGETRVYDLGAPAPAGRVIGAQGVVTRIGVSADGTRVVTLAGGVLTGHAVAADVPPAVIGEGGPVHAFALAPTGTLCALAIATQVQIADLGSGRVLHRLPTRKPVPALAFDPAGERLAACERGRFTVWSTASGQVLVEQEAHRNQILWDIAWSLDGEWLATAGLDNATQVFSSRDGALVHQFRLLAAHPRMVRFCADGQRLAASASNGQVILYRLDDRPGHLALRGHRGGVHSARFSADGARIVSASADGTARVWDRHGRTLQTLDPHAGPVVGARWAADGASILTVTAAGSACVWDVASGTGVPLPVTQVADAWFDAGGRALALTRTGQIERFMPSGTPVPLGVTTPAVAAGAGKEKPAARVQAAVLDSKGQRLAVGYESPQVDVVDLGESARARAFAFASQAPALPRPQVMTLQFSPSGRYLAVGGEDTVVQLLDAETLRVLGSTGKSTPGCVAFDAAESHLVIGGMFNPEVALTTIGPDGIGPDKTLILDHRDRITAVDFHRDGALFLTASNDGTVLLYRTRDCAKYAVLAGHDHAVTAAVFSPDGASILTASLDGTLRLWPVDPVALAVQRLPRSLTTGERLRLARDLAGN